MTDRTAGVPHEVIPNPDPSVITSDAIDRRVSNSERVISARIDGMEKAVGVFQGDLTRVPTQLDRAIAGQRDLVEAQLEGRISTVKQRLDGMDKAIELFQKFTDKQPEFVRDQVTHLKELHDAEFKGIQSQLTLAKEAAKQLDTVNQTAITSALTAQKEQAAETQKSSQAAIAKSEASTTEAIRALTATFNTAIAGLQRELGELKGRIDRGEGRTSISDPETTTTLRLLADKMSVLTDAHHLRTGGDKASSDNTARTISFAAIIIAAVAAAAAVGTMLTHMH